MIKAETGNHAMIAAEGKKDGRVYWALVHLQGPSSFKDKRNGSSCYFGKRGHVEVKEFHDSEKIKFGAKTETWQRSRAKIEEMLEEAKTEAALLVSEVVDNPSPFSIFGRKSVFTRPVKQIEVTSPELLRLRREDPRLFKSVCQDSRDPNNWTKRFRQTFYSFAVLHYALSLVAVLYYQISLFVQLIDPLRN